MAEGDLYGLSMALEAAAGEKALIKDRSAGVKIKTKLASLAALYGVPKKGSSRTHVEASEAGWVAHLLRVDNGRRLTIRTMVIGFSNVSSRLPQLNPAAT